MAIYTLQNTLLPVTGPAPFFLGGGGGAIEGQTNWGGAIKRQTNFLWGGGAIRSQTNSLLRGGIVGHSPLYYRTIHMFLVFGSLMFFYQIINIKVLNNVKTNNVFKSI